MMASDITKIIRAERGGGEHPLPFQRFPGIGVFAGESKRKAYRMQEFLISPSPGLADGVNMIVLRPKERCGTKGRPVFGAFTIPHR